MNVSTPIDGLAGSEDFVGWYIRTKDERAIRAFAKAFEALKAKMGDRAREPAEVSVCDKCGAARPLPAILLPLAQGLRAELGIYCECGHRIRNTDFDLMAPPGFEFRFEDKLGRVLVNCYRVEERKPS